jgi:hypothetical protein
VFVYGSEPQILVTRAAGREPLRARYHYLIGPTEACARGQQEVLAELRAAPPRFVVGVFLRTSLLESPDSPVICAAASRGCNDYRPIVVRRRGRRTGVDPDRRGTLRVWRQRRSSSAVPEGLIVVWERLAAEARPWP